MNLIKMHSCLTKPLWHVAVQALTVCTPAYRPMGGLFYRTIYDYFHFDPLPFRVACYCILAVNIVLAGWLLRCVAGLWEIAAVGTLLFSFHAMLIGLFYNTGTVYDLLCATFYFFSLLYYVYGRNKEPQLTFRPLILLFVLYSCALDSKEMAASLPIALLAYELVYHGVPKEWSRRVWLRFRAIAVLALWTAAFTAVKTFVPTPMSVNAAYHPHLAPDFLLRNLSLYYNFLIYQHDFFTPQTIMAVVTLMFAASWLLRSRAMLFGLLFALITMLPVLIIPPRGGFVLYLPLFGWATWAAVPIVRTRAAITKLLFRGSTRPSVQTAMQAALLTALIILLYPIHQRKRNDFRFALRLEQSQMRDLLTQLKKQVPVFPHNSRILFIKDPFRRDDWELLFLIQMEYADPTLWVARKKDTASYNEESKQTFQYIFSYEQDELHQITK